MKLGNGGGCGKVGLDQLECMAAHDKHDCQYTSKLEFSGDVVGLHLHVRDKRPTIPIICAPYHV